MPWKKYRISGAQHGTSGNSSDRLRDIAAKTRTTKANVATALQMISWGLEVNDYGNAQLDENGNFIKDDEGNYIDVGWGNGEYVKGYYHDNAGLVSGELQGELDDIRAEIIAGTLDVTAPVPEDA